ncbi:MAG: PilZ domain-containing protein [Gammaproteobacteria bacterium]
MPRDYDEKRDYVRVHVESDMYYQSEYDDEPQVGKLQNLSGRGLMFIASHPISKESMIDIRIDPTNKITPPLTVTVRVVRVTKQRHGDGYEIGAVMQKGDEDLFAGDEELQD